MKKIKITNNKNGSTLLLAMVIVSTILLTGVGVGLILSRQTRDAGVMRGEAVAHYVADSAIEKVAQTGEGWDEEIWNPFDYAGMEATYRAEKIEGNKYRITVNVQNNYYSFVRELPVDLDIDDFDEELFFQSSEAILIYYEGTGNPDDEVNFKYSKWVDGSAITDEKIMHQSILFPELVVTALSGEIMEIWNVEFCINGTCDSNGYGHYNDWNPINYNLIKRIADSNIRKMN